MSDRSAAPIAINDPVLIASNRHGYRFLVGRISGGGGDRWVGYSVSRLDDGRLFACFFPQVSEGHVMGLRDRATAIRLTGAVALDSEEGFGGVDRWFVGPELRGDPADFRCPDCGEIHLGACEPDDFREGDEL